MIHADPAPLQKVLGPEVAAVYRSLHDDHGVEMRMNTGSSPSAADCASRKS